MNAAKVYRLSESGSEERGGVSFAFKAACKKTACSEKSCFDRVKMVLFYTTIEKF